MNRRIYTILIIAKSYKLEKYIFTPPLSKTIYAKTHIGNIIQYRVQWKKKKQFYIKRDILNIYNLSLYQLIYNRTCEIVNRRN